MRVRSLRCSTQHAQGRVWTGWGGRGRGAGPGAGTQGGCGVQARISVSSCVPLRQALTQRGRIFRICAAVMDESHMFLSPS